MPCLFGPAIFKTSLKEIAMKLIQGSFAKRALLVGLIAGSGVLAASSFAMPEAAPAGKAGCEARHAHQAHGMPEARRAERLAGLKEKLKLSAAQEAAWNAFAGANQPAMHQGTDRKAMRGEFEKMNTPQRLDAMQAMSEMRRARMAERTKAIKAFYAELGPEQQAVFDAEAKFGQHRGHARHRYQS